MVKVVHSPWWLSADCPFLFKSISPVLVMCLGTVLGAGDSAVNTMSCGALCIWSVLNLQLLEQCLVHSRRSINICWGGKWISRENKNSRFILAALLSSRKGREIAWGPKKQIEHLGLSSLDWRVWTGLWPCFSHLRISALCYPYLVFKTVSFHVSLLIQNWNMYTLGQFKIISRTVG